MASFKEREEIVGTASYLARDRGYAEEARGDLERHGGVGTLIGPVVGAAFFLVLRKTSRASLPSTT